MHEQNGRNHAHDIPEHMFLKTYFFMLIEMSLRFLPAGPSDNKVTLVLVMVMFTDAYIGHRLCVKYWNIQKAYWLMRVE